MTNQEIRTIEHKGVKVSFKIDYDEGTATLVEKMDGEWRQKKWLFAHRELEYMKGWQNILEAMSEAVEICKVELDRDRREKSRFTEEQQVKFALMAQEIKESELSLCKNCNQMTKHTRGKCKKCAK